MDDRTLLELAAKAAGYKVVWRDQYDCGLTDTCLAPLPKAAQHFVFVEYPHKKWRPLDSDGAALRLAVKLHISVQPEDEGTAAISADHEQASINRCARRAIVNVAAAIGKEMP